MSNGKPPKTVADWVRYLHTARAVPKDAPDYADAQEAVRFALQRIRTLNAEANSADQAQADNTGKPVGPGAAAGVGLLQGLGLGTGEPIAGLISKLGGGTFGEGAAQYRQGLENVGVQQPAAAVGGEFGGRALTSLAPISQAVQGGTATAAAIPAGRAGILARFLTGAGQTNVIPGLILGGVQGFSAGGEDPGDLKARLESAGMGAAMGAVSSAVLGGLGALRVPRWLGQARRQVRSALPKTTPPDVVEGITDVTIRRELARQGFDAQSQERVLGAWRAGKTKIPPLPPVQEPVAMRPGETVTTSRPAPDPLETPAYQRRGVGGHSYTGTYPAGTTANIPGRAAPSPMGGPQQNMELQQLQVLAQMPEADFQQVKDLFPPQLMQQLKAIRVQLGVPGAKP